MNIKKILSGIATLTIATTLFIGCGTSKESTTDGTSKDLPKVVNVGTIVSPNDEEIAKVKGLFEKEMGVDVNVVEFDSGKDVNSALVSGSIDFGLMGSTAATLGIANGIDIEMIWIHKVIGKVESLAVKNSANINSVSDLKGKKIAAPFASTAHYSLLNALKLNNISEEDVTLLDMQPNDIYAAWQRGDIDAAYIWQPTLDNLLKDGKILISSEDMAEKGVITSDVEVVRKEFSKKYPDIVAKYIKAVDESVKLYNENQDDAVKTTAKALNIEEKDALNQMQGSIWLTAEQQLDPKYFGSSNSKGKLVDSLKDTADFLLEQKSIKSVPEISVFENAINPSYIEKSLK